MIRDYSTNKSEQIDELGINDPAETSDGRQIADDGMRNETWACTRTHTDDGPAWKYWGSASESEWIRVTNPQARFELDDEEGGVSVR